jgi:curved DNA-binding protein CbpA
MSEQRDPYDVLRLPRDADPRAVKAAYFALVREFPPETHPAEFQALREAYEVLSDPERREQLDASREALSGLDAEQAALLQAARAAFAQGDVAGALSMLRRLVADAPDLLVAREQLGLALLRARAFDEASQVWTALTEREPGNPRHHLHLGYARQGLDQPIVAVESHRRALQLGGGDDARVALADALADAGRWREGVQVLDEGIAAAGDAPPPPLVRKEVAVLLLHGQARMAWQAFDRLARVLEDHPQQRAAHAESLASLAAWIFAQGKEKLANELLRRLGALDPGRKPDRVFPSRATVHTADLPPESRAWLAGEVEQPRRHVVSRRRRAWALLALVPGAALFSWTVARAMGDERWGGEGLAWTGVLCLAAAAALVFGGSRFHSALTSALPKMTLLHPVYFLKVDYDRVHVFPLVNLHDVKVVRHTTNGVYTHTQVHLPFGRRTLQLRFRKTDEAGQLAQALLDRRRRMLELVANGLVETEPGIDLVPAALLAGGAGRRPRWPFLAAATIALGALGHGASARVHARALEQREWSEALALGTPTALRRYLAEYPGRADRVHAALEAWVSELEHGPAALPPGPARARALTVARALAAGAPRDVSTQVSWAAPAPDAGEGVACGFAPSGRARMAPLAELQAAFDRTFGDVPGRVVRLDLQSRPARPEELALELSVSAGEARSYRASGAALPELRTADLGYALKLRVPGAAPIELSGSVPPPAVVEVLPEAPAGPPPPAAPPATGPSPQAACEAVTAAQLAALGARLAAELGLSASAREVSP